MSTRAEVGEQARALLRRAIALLPDGAIDEALAAAEKAVEQAPGFGDAYCYLGNTLVTRRRRFADAESGVALYDYSPLPPVRGDRLRGDAALQARCAATLRRLHRDVPGFAATFDPFERIDHFLIVLAGLDASQPPEHAAVQRGVEALRVIAHSPPVTTPCHVDSYCENFLADGSRTLLIDWEYSGIGDPMWDLANFSRENGLDAAVDAHVLRSYFRAEPPPSQVARFEVYKPLCDLFWASWCLVQVAVGNDTSDWDATGRRRLLSAETTLGDDGFGAVLARTAVGG